MDHWQKGVDAQGEPCEYNIYTGNVRYSIDNPGELTQEEVDDLMKGLRPVLIPAEAESNPKKEACPDCKGTGEYVGSFVVEDCRTCKGIGKI